MKHIRLFELKQDAVSAQDLITPNVSYCEENDQIVMLNGVPGAPMEIILDEDGNLEAKPKTGEATRLYGTKRPDAFPYIDIHEYYTYVGTFEYEGETYFKWTKTAKDGESGDEEYNDRFCILTDTRDFSTVSFNNPYRPIGCMLDDVYDEDGYFMIPLIYFGGTTEPEIIYPELPHHDTESMDKNGYEYVDLGLPSGALWAKFNIGAESEEEYGRYFQWGDTVGYTGEDAKTNSYWSTCPFNDGSSFYDEEYFLANKSEWLDINNDLKPQYDAAHINMGGDWHLPNNILILELLSNTDSEWIEDYEGTGINGRLFTSRSNNNTLFIPASGYVYSGSFSDVGGNSYSWSSRLDSAHPDGAINLSCGSDGAGVHFYERYSGFALRGVIW